MRAFWKRKPDPGPIDAIAEIEDYQSQMEGRLEGRLEGQARPDMAGAARPTAPGAKAFFVLLLLMTLMFLGTMCWKALTSQSAKDDLSAPSLDKIENLLPRLKLQREAHENAPSPAPPSPEPAPIVPQRSPLAQDLSGELLATLTEDPITVRRLSSGLKSEDGESQSSTTAPSETHQGDTGPMAERLKPLRLAAARAGLIPDRDMVLTQGALIECVEQTRLVSAQAGMMTCHATRDVRSASGRVILVDAGTKFIGYQQGVLAHGQPRIAVVWSRMESPEGVVIHLDSPGTGSLGEAGLDGHIDTHFAERFGAAILVSLISDIGDWAANRGGKGDGAPRFDSTGEAAQDVITTVLDHTINIPPTLYRHPGGRVGIYVARDLDFSTVYRLKPLR